MTSGETGYPLRAPTRRSPAIAETATPTSTRVEFTDQADGSVVLASPITAAEVADAMRADRRSYRLGDWIVTRVGGATPGRSELVVQSAFLSRYTPANEAARRLLRRLAQTPGFLDERPLDPGR